MSTPSTADTTEILAIEVGSSRVKFGRFAANVGCPSGKPASDLPIAAPLLPEPLDTISLAHHRDFAGTMISELAGWLVGNFSTEPRCYLASVQPTVAAQLVEYFEMNGWSPPRQLTWRDLPLEVRVEELARVGIDRLLNAVAVNRLREPARPAIVVDLGTAGTVNLVAADGAFEGGAILPGMALAAEALHTGTSALPRLETAIWTEPVDVVGKSTSAAMASGIYWGIVGAVGELVERIAGQCSQSPQLFVTGGAAPHVVQRLAVAGSPARHVPHLVLSAIRIVAEQLR
jgi:type III pantothenate kinase